MAQGLAVTGIPPRRAGWRLAFLALVALLAVAVATALLWYGRLGRQAPKAAQTIQEKPLAADLFMPATNGAKRVEIPLDEAAKRERAEMLKALKRQEEINAKMLAELEALKQKRQTSTMEPNAEKPPTRARAKAVYVVNDAKPPAHAGVPLYTLAVWEYLPCALENVVNSEVPGTFTVTLTRPVLDATRQHVLLPQGQRVGAKAATAELLLGNERMPTFALSARLPNGQALDLGHAPIMDAAGTNGLTGIVLNHWWRIVWTSLAIEGLRAGQQVLTQEIASQGDGVTVTGIGQHSTNIAQQRLGRAQDTRPTIIAESGQLCQILIPKAMELPSFALAQR